MFKNSSDAYGSGTKLFHWISAVIVIGLLAAGLVMEDLPNGLLKLRTFLLHKSFGITILILTILRILWHLHTKKPALVDSLKPWEKKLAHLGHIALYVLMIGMPLSGWIMSSAAGRPVSVFGLFTLSNLVAENHDLKELFEDIHGLLGNALIAVVALHIAAALKHHFFDKDKTLRRMLP